MIIDNLDSRSTTSTKSHEEVNNMVKFIHASDIHLGSQQYSNEYRSNDFIRAFQEILSLAVKHRVDFVIFGGDVFTSLEMLPKQLTIIVNILNTFKNYTSDSIPLIAIEGNHDIRKFSRGVRLPRRAQSWLKFLANLGLIILLDADFEAPSGQLFTPYDCKTREGGKIQIKNVTIHGTRFLGQKPEEFIQKIKKAIKKDDRAFNILLQHFGIEGQMKNVPGIEFRKIMPLKDRVNYLALGHYHLQYVLDDWIYNPGSSEATCSMDSSYKRGVFLVELSRDKRFAKRVHIIRLNNRNHLWETFFIQKQFNNKEKLHEFILQKLTVSLDYLNSDLNPSDIKMPLLYLRLTGKKPTKSCKIDIKTLRKRITEIIPVVDVKIYQKFTDVTRTIDKYL